ncbi:hypothetical protein BGW37DRAFT_84163 [Umbelopsis sp. PMI_123]|nr:hypothetical protein BGW37DRAFT_84163 [Umbelopsis sp. PMI_123]
MQHDPQPQSKEWIRDKIQTLRQKSNVSFNQDLFISILLCLISGPGRHLILTASEDQLPNVISMANKVFTSVFGFTCANINCHPNQTSGDFVQHLFVPVHEENGLDPTSLQTNGMTRMSSNRSYSSYQSNDSSWTSSLASTQPMRQHGSNSSSLRPHGKEERMFKSLTQRRTSASGQSTASSLDSRHRFTSSPGFGGSTGPISPIDFTINRKSQEFSLHHYRGQDDREYGRFRKSDFGDSSKSFIPTRIAQAVIVKNLHQASDLVQATLLEIIIVQQLKIHSATYNVPNPFIVIAVMPQDAPPRSILSQLIDRFFVSYRFDDESLSDTPNAADVRHNHNQSMKRQILFRHQEIKELAASVNRVNVNVDIIIYIRDIVVGIRTHRLVHCGLTARASQDLVLVVKALSALFKREYVTPDLVSIAAEKVFSHRLVLKDEAYSQRIVPDTTDSDDQSEMNSIVDEAADILPADIVMEILRAVHVPF